LTDADPFLLGALSCFPPPGGILDVGTSLRLEHDAISFLLPQPISGGRFPVVL
jgi:hypothetical protein